MSGGGTGSRDDGPPGLYDRALTDPAFLGRFTAAYTGRHDPLDALFWTQHPGETAPSGAPDPVTLLRQVRVAVYRPNADDTDHRRVADLAEAVEQDRAAVTRALAVLAAEADLSSEASARDDGQDRRGDPLGATAGGAPPGRLRPALIAGGALVAAAALVVAGVSVTGTTRRPVPRATTAPAVVADRLPAVAVPVAYLGDAASAARARRDLAALVDHRIPGRLTLFLAQNDTALPGLYRASSVSKAGTAVGPHTFSLSGIERNITTGLATVLLTCSRPTPFSWRLDARAGRSERVHGADCHGHVVATGVVLQRGHPPTVLHVDVPAGVRVLMEIDLSRY